MCVCRSWHTKSHFPQNLDARIVKVNMLLILQYVSFPWWSYIDRQLQGDKLSLDIDDLNEDGGELPRMRGRPHGTSQQPNVGVQLLDGNNKPHVFSADVLSQMSVVQLRTLCAAHGLSTCGTKAVFRERILRKQDHIEGPPKQYPTESHVSPPPSPIGDYPHLNARNCHFSIEYWPDERNNSIGHNIHLAACAWLSTAAVQFLLGVLLPPGTTSVKPGIIDMQWAQLMRHFPTLSLICTEKCALPLLLKLGRLKHRKHLPENDTSTDVWYLDRYDFYLELPNGLQLKYPDLDRYYRRTRRNPSEASALASNPAEDMANKSLSSDSDDAVDGDRYKADPPDNGKERPYWWPSPPERMQREIRDNLDNKWRLRRRTAIPRWNFYLPYGEDAEKYFLENILLSQPFTKEDHEQRFFSKDKVSKTYMEECILRGLFRGYEEVARETLNNAQARGYSVERLRLLAEVLRAEDIIDATFFNNYMSDLDELNKHRAGDDEPMVADEAELDPHLAEELRAFMNANDPAAGEPWSML